MAKRSPPVAHRTVEEFMEALDLERRATVDRLRQLALAAAVGVSEHMKWNRVTLGLERDGTIRMVLHRGAKPKDTTGFAFADQTKRPAPDRGVVKVRDVSEVEARQDALSDLLRRWFETV